MKRKIVIAAIGDLHAGGTTALCPRGVQLDDGGTYRLSKPQLHLLRSWEDYWQNRVYPLLDKNTDLYIFANGDCIDGDHHETSQIITRNITTQIDIARELLDEPVQKAKGIIFVRGTQVHVGEAARAEESLAEDFSNAIRDEYSASWWQFVGELNGVKFDSAHHTNAGGRIRRNRPGAAIRLAYDTRELYIERGEQPPDYVIRSHIHRFMDSGRNFPTRAITIPCWQMSTSHGKTKYVGDEPDIGGLVFTISADGQQHGFQEWIYKPMRRKVWKNADN